MPDKATVTRRRKKQRGKSKDEQPTEPPVEEPKPEPEPELTPAEIHCHTGLRLVFYYPSDFVRDVAWEQQVLTGMEVMQKWVLKTLGRTFRVLVPSVVKSASTWKHIMEATDGGEFNAWKFAMNEAEAQRMIRICDDDSWHYLVTPANKFSGGMVGSENWGCRHVWPGKTCISGKMGRLAGGIAGESPDISVRALAEVARAYYTAAPRESWEDESHEWWADEPIEAWRAMMHEMGHALEALPHGTYDDPPSIMLQWWDQTAEWRDYEKEKLLNGPVGSRFLVLEEVPE